MQRKSIVFMMSILALLLVSIGYIQAQAQSPLETLNQYISDLQKNPNDNVLREKIIKFTQTIKPAPAISAEAEKYEGRAEYAIKNAKTEADFLDAANEYDKALLLAPWVSSYYFNQAIAYEKAAKTKEAKQSFEFYLLAAPNAQDTREVRKRIAGLEYSIEKAAKESSMETIAAKQQNAYETWLKSMDGARFISPPQDNYHGGTAYIVYYIEGSKVHLGWFDREPADFRTSSIRQVEFANKSWSVDIRGKQFVVPQPAFLGVPDITATINDDSQFITFDRGTTVYRRVK